MMKSSGTSCQKPSVCPSGSKSTLVPNNPSKRITRTMVRMAAMMVAGLFLFAGGVLLCESGDETSRPRLT